MFRTYTICKRKNENYREELMFLVAIWFLNIRVLNITYGLKQPGR
ncbi:hypothetical protein EC2875000_3272 [Escherichia coli 2875000]|nr:hypothetical protein HMPREF9551_03673 [Escherichia coli MS 196-1]EFK52586.1 hypothetical protein HMPREF9345_00615 [Escherichia coli MS 107-1]EGU98980.1 hypothetical protein HMPREF9349_00953 [Escherichia coli MS 79-10]EHW08598.1 hypothetical protein ECDEC8B_3925 [Escherichia coli DEC8B]EHX29151.1 hypothetical protein ECDEC12C_3768 [Escherichia coli DEC12C]EMV37297.1 hypothetical protein EC2875000_3272 [Escherichia coli 2875000]EMV92459.1 hypothetical protein EC2860050_3349 [Escherichia coli